jgi:hypothetical protein
MPSYSKTIQYLRRIMRNNWMLTRLETALFVAAVMLMAGGVVWATGIG